MPGTTNPIYLVNKGHHLSNLYLPMSYQIDKK